MEFDRNQSSVINRSDPDSIINQYSYPGEILSVKAYGNGHINDTYIIKYNNEKQGTREKRILQKINVYVFKKPLEVMWNIESVTEHLRNKIKSLNGDCQRETLSLIKTKSGENCCFDREGNCYREYLFIDNALTKEAPGEPEDMYEAAKVFGRFQRLLADYPADTLYHTIPDFHNTKIRYDAFLKAVDLDEADRAEEVRAEIDFVKARAKDTGILVDLLESGKLPLRVTHNDTKLNNVLIDESTGKGICAIDLDTVMPGLSLYDFGDAIRFGGNTAAEDEVDLQKVSLSMAHFEAYTKGYLEEAGSELWDKEIEMLPTGAKIICLECGMRFLTDYLQGDKYFKIHREKHNLDRCRTQFKMVEEIERNWAALHAIVRKYAG